MPSPTDPAPDSAPVGSTSESNPAKSEPPAERPRIKIGSQRTGNTRVLPPHPQPEMLRAPVVVPGASAAAVPASASAPAAALSATPTPTGPTAASSAPVSTALASPPPAPVDAEPSASEVGSLGATTQPAADTTSAASLAPAPATPAPATLATAADREAELGQKLSRGKRPGKQRPQVEQYTRQIEVPNIRAALSADLEAELAEALGEASLDSLIDSDAVAAPAVELAPDQRRRGQVVSVHRDLVFIDLGGRDQGALPLAQFAEAPAPGTVIEVVVRRFDAEEGLFDLSLPGGTVDVGDWSQVEEGLVVEARITGHNKGGLECEVGNLRGFIPAGQVSLYRVEDFSQFVGERWPCLVTEANPSKRNLVLSRRAMLEKDQAEAKRKLLGELAPGQVRDAIVRNLRDFGAFVDLGGVDGLIHVSQLGWQRVKHPSEVLEVGQKVSVKVQKIDPDTGKISLSLRDLIENPWVQAAQKYPVSSRVRGTVTKLMDFGAFVQIEPGVEGLVHISELDHKRVFRVSDVVQPGQTVEAKVLSLDPEAQRMSLSIKAIQARPEPAAAAEPEVQDDAAAAEPVRRKSPATLKGGIGGPTGGDKFGLKW